MEQEIRKNPDHYSIIFLGPSGEVGGRSMVGNTLEEARNGSGGIEKSVMQK